MPGYKWLFDNKPMDVSLTQKKMEAMVTLGVPYSDAELQTDLKFKSSSVEN
jgi:cytochrome c oxidase cbb3-type subunit I/II